ncbi:MAG TPA: hypothetical protein VFL79_19605 [Terriglobia bacterium]|nr:hypothetical protein [Terriglobia bacterium]
MADKTENSDPRVTQIYNLKALSRQYRDSFLGPSWLETARQLFELPMHSSAYGGSLHPVVTIPQFQELALMEATDLASIIPRVVIQRTREEISESEPERDREREKAFEDHWNWIQAGTALFFSTLWSMYAGTGWLEVGADPMGNQGNGQISLSWLDPGDVYPDPFARWQNPASLNWSYVVIERMMSLDDIESRFSAWGKGPGALVGNKQSEAPAFGTLPRSGEDVAPPIKTLWGPGSPDVSPARDARAETRRGVVPGHVCFVRDFSEYRPSSARSTEIGKTGIEIPGGRFRYPYGRMLIEAGGAILYDGVNPWGGINGETLFPVIPTYAVPPMTSIWAPPPYRFSGGLQELAGQILSQMYENIVRCNKAVTYVWQDNALGDDFGNLPGEIATISGQRPPVHVWANAMPQWVFQQPQYLLDRARELQGYNPPRMGEASAGNVGADLFDATIGEGRKLTRMRSLLLYPSLNLLTKLIYGGMCRFYRNSVSFPSFNSDEADESRWKPGGDDGSCRLHPGSVEVVSETAARRLTLQARQLGLIGKERTLEDLRYPHAKDAAEELEQEEKLAALAALRKR